MVNLPHQEDSPSADASVEANPGSMEGLQVSSVLIASSQQEAFLHSLSKLNRKAKAFGLAPVEILYQQECVFARVYEATRNGDLIVKLVPPRALKPAERSDAVLLSMLRIQISYPIIRMGNWQVVGKLERESGADAFAYVCNDEPDTVSAITRYRDSEPVCEHCRVKRRRNDYYVVRDSETRTFKQVGSSCLKDFTGIDPAAALFLAKLWSFINTSPELRLDGAGLKSQVLTPEDAIAQTLFIVQQLGFHSRSKVREEGGCATVEHIQRFNELLREDRDLQSKWHELGESESFRSQVGAMLEVYRAMPPSSNLFEENVRRALCQDLIPLFGKVIGFVVAAVARRYLDSLKPKVQSKPSEHVGTVGEKMQRTLRLTRRFVMDGMWGPTWTLLFEDDDHNVFVWKTGSPSDELAHAELPTAPEKYRFTIKDHGEYRGTAQTEMLRVKSLGA